jgi:hypothetical protein
VEEGYISVTPLGIDITDYVLLEKLQALDAFGSCLPSN